ncbi:hypothetical protein, partial [Streptococcus pneumoniae]|uniref:hypothetical protein n=1 Tax=Streptococcus pneumoniae TaxID=1313 RepID=UPI001E3CE6D3
MVPESPNRQGNWLLRRVDILAVLFDLPEVTFVFDYLIYFAVEQAKLMLMAIAVSHTKDVLRPNDTSLVRQAPLEG